MYENIVAKSKNFIGYVTYFYFNKDKSDKIRPKDENADEIFKPIDLKSYGRCYTGYSLSEALILASNKPICIIVCDKRLFVEL